MSDGATGGGRADRSGGGTRRRFEALALRCPVCNAEFTSEIPQWEPPHERDSDLCPRFETPNPLPSLIHSCPSCLFTAYRQGYGAGSNQELEDLETLVQAPGDRLPPRFAVPPEGEIEQLRRWVRRGDLAAGIVEGRAPFGAERYLLAARCHEFVKDDDQEGVADHLLRASWCARATGDRQLERRIQIDTVARLQASLDHGQVSDFDQPRVRYLIGELSRRVADYARAVDVFVQLERDLCDEDDDEAVFFARLARRQVALATVKSDVNASLIPEVEDEPADDDPSPQA